MTEPLTDDELAVLEARYTEESVPVCPVCGDRLSMMSFRHVEPRVWGCDPWEPDPDEPGQLRLKPGRGQVLTKTEDRHYNRSRFVQRRKGDELVLRAVAELRQLQERERELMLLIAWYHSYQSDASVKALLGYDGDAARKRYWEALAEGALISPETAVQE